MKSSFSFSVSRVGAVAFALMAVLSFHVSAAAQWKWKDQSGRVQYSDLPPPPGVAEKDILQTPAGQRHAPTYAPAAPASASAPALPTSAPKDPELEAKREKLKQEEAAKRKADEDRVAAAKAENCTRAQGQMRNLSSGERLARINAKGEREVMDDKTVAAETQRTRDLIASQCK
jgi:hypothetical protein